MFSSIRSYVEVAVCIFGPWVSVMMCCVLSPDLVWDGDASGTSMDKWQVNRSLQIKSSSPGWENFHKNIHEKMLPVKGWNNIRLKQAIHFSPAKSGTSAVYQPTSFDSSRGLSWICCRISWPTKPIKPTQKPKCACQTAQAAQQLQHEFVARIVNHCFVFYVVRLPIFS